MDLREKEGDYLHLMYQGPIQTLSPIPLTGPSLGFAWEQEYYCDISMHFGAWAGSFHMQSVANCITDVLHEQGVHCYMYLDDLVILSNGRATVAQDFRKWDYPRPGIIVDARNNILFILPQKLQGIMDIIQQTYVNYNHLLANSCLRQNG